MEFKNYTINKFLDDLKADLPSPGGGSTAALVSALSAALNSMVYSFTIDKRSFDKLSDEEKEKMNYFNEKSSNFINDSLEFMEADRSTFTALMETFKLPKDTESEKLFRSSKIREKTIEAMESPLNLAKASLDFYENIDFAIKYGNKNLTSDAIVAAILLHSAIESAIVNVLVNYNSLANKAGYENVSTDCINLIEESLNRKTKILKAFGI